MRGESRLNRHKLVGHARIMSYRLEYSPSPHFALRLEMNYECGSFAHLALDSDRATHQLNQ
jgi:hypothetical protein